MQEAAALEIQQLRLLMGSDRDPLGRVFAQLADALRRSGELDEALAVARRGTEDDPHFMPGHLVMGWVQQDRGESDAALASFHRTIDLDPENPFGLYGAGTLLDARGDAQGRDLLTQARDLMPGVDEAAPRSAFVPLADLPFVSLADLAPDGVEADAGAVQVDAEDISHLPFVSLEELAPDGPVEEAAAAVDDDLIALPFVSLADLAPADDEVGLAAAEAAAELEPWADDADGEAGLVDEAEDPEVEVLAVEASDEEDDAAHAVEDAYDGVADDDDDELPGDPTPVTRTMAEILVGQGLLDRAIEVYRQLVDATPDSDALRERLSELEARLAGEEGDPGEGQGADDETPAEGSTADYFGQLLSWGGGAGHASDTPASDSDDSGDDRSKA